MFVHIKTLLERVHRAVLGKSCCKFECVRYSEERWGCRRRGSDAADAKKLIGEFDGRELACFGRREPFAGDEF